MKTANVAAWIVIATAMGTGPSFAAVVQYPYCIIYRDGARGCGFRNLQECVQVRVGADMCVVNPYYTGPLPPSKRRRSRQLNEVRSRLFPRVWA